MAPFQTLGLGISTCSLFAEEKRRSWRGESRGREGVGGAKVRGEKEWRKGKEKAGKRPKERGTEQKELVFAHYLGRRKGGVRGAKVREDK